MSGSCSCYVHCSLWIEIGAGMGNIVVVVATGIGLDGVWLGLD